MSIVSCIVGVTYEFYDRCDTPEQLRSHLNHDCHMLPQMKLTEERVIPGLIEVERPVSGTTTVPPISDPSSSTPISVQSTMQVPILQQASIVSEPPSSKPTTVRPVAAQPLPPDDLDLSSAEIDALLQMDLNSTLPAPVPEVCSICRDSADDASNPLLCCALCGVVVHTSCYGVVSTPSARWQCDVGLNESHES